MAANASRADLLRLLAITARTLLISALGGAAFALVGFPVPWLSGGMLAVAVVTVAGAAVAMPHLLRETAFFIIGLSIGTALRPEIVAGVAVWPLSLLVLCLFVPIVTAAGAAVLMARGGWERQDAILASLPGALSMVLALAEQCRADVARVAIVQNLRLVILIIVLPPLISLLGNGTLSVAAPVTGTPGAAALAELPLVVAAGVAGLLVMRIARVPAPSLMGAMLGSGVLYGTGTLDAAVPEAALTAGFIVVGAMVGTRFKGVSPRTLLACLTDGLIAFLAAVATSLTGAVLVTLAFGFPLGQTVLAFAPGGFEVMTVMALALGFDAAYVVVHQLVRFLALAIAAPLALRPRGDRRERNAIRRR